MVYEKQSTSLFDSQRDEFGEWVAGDMCVCGRHRGFGDKCSSYHRAQIYAWYRKWRQKDLTPVKAAYLDSYEAAHGKVERCLNGRRL